MQDYNRFPGEPFTGSDRALLKRMLATLRIMHERAKSGRTGLHAHPVSARQHYAVAAGHIEGLLTEDHNTRKDRKDEREKHRRR